MRPGVLLRVAAVFTSLLAAGHTAGFPWVPVHTARSDVLVAEMKAYTFPVMGFTRGYWDFYVGFGLSVSVALLAFAILLWQLAALAKTTPRAARPFIVTLLAAFAGFTVLDCLYFFAAPLALTAPVALCLILAWVAAGKTGGGTSPG